MRHLPLLLAAVAACAPTRLPPPSPHDPAAREAVLLTAHDLAPGRKCRIVEAEAPLPAVATLLDTAAIPELFQQAAVTTANGYALFSIRFDSAGHPSRARLIDATIADSLRDGVQQSVASALLDQAAGPQHPIRLRVDFAAHPTFRVGKSEYCEAEQIVPRGGGNYSTFDRPGERTVSRGTATVNYEVDVSRAGEVLGIRFSSALDVEVEQAMRQSMMKTQWKPAVDDGMLVASRVSASTHLEKRTVARVVGSE